MAQKCRFSQDNFPVGVWTIPEMGANTVSFVSNLCITTINLPRQARDKHRENSPKRLFSPSGYYGLTKAAAIKKGIDAEEGKAPYTSCLRGRVFAPQGFLKLVFEKGSGVIIGVHILGTCSGQFKTFLLLSLSESFSLPLPRFGSIRDTLTT